MSWNVRTNFEDGERERGHRHCGQTSETTTCEAEDQRRDEENDVPVVKPQGRRVTVRGESPVGGGAAATTNWVSQVLVGRAKLHSQTLVDLIDALGKVETNGDVVTVVKPQRRQRAM